MPLVEDSIPRAIRTRFLLAGGDGEILSRGRESRPGERAVKEVARELDRRNTLSGERVSEIVGKYA